MKTQLLTALFIAYGFCLFAQIKGIVKDRESSLPVFGAIIISSEQSNTTSNEQGAFSFNVDKFPVTLITIYFFTNAQISL